MTRMRVCLISNLFGANARGGAERIVALEAERLVSRGHRVTVVAGSAVAEGPESGDGPMRVIRFRPPNVFFYADASRHGILARFLWHGIDMLNVPAARKLRAVLDRERPDVVHTHNLMGIGFLAPRAVRKLRLPHVHTVHDVQLLHPSGLLLQEGPRLGPFSRAARSVYAACMRKLMGSPDVVIFPSRYLADLHARQGFFPRSKIELLPNPASAAASAVAGTRDRVLFVGQLEAHKGVMTLLDAWDRRPMPGMTLEIVGTGALADEVRARAERSERAVVRGFLRGPELDAAYARAAYVVVPSLVIENQPTVILEAYARGIPVIAAATGGIPELVEDGRTGLLFAPGSADALANAFTDAPSRLADAERVRARIAEVIKKHDIGTHVERLEEIYEEARKRESGRV